MTFGPVILADFGEGSFITCQADQDDYRTERGTDGKVDFVRLTGRTFTVEAGIMQTSPINDLLSSLRMADLTASVGAWPLLIKDLEGFSLQAFPQARIIAPPSMSYGVSTSDRIWRFKCINGDMFVGGNTISPIIPPFL